MDVSPVLWVLGEYLPTLLIAQVDAIYQLQGPKKVVVVDLEPYAGLGTPDSKLNSGQGFGFREWKGHEKLLLVIIWLPQGSMSSFPANQRQASVKLNPIP